MSFSQITTQVAVCMKLTFESWNNYKKHYDKKKNTEKQKKGNQVKLTVNSFAPVTVVDFYHHMKHNGLCGSESHLLN